jgi:hypothetical protein
MKIQKKMKNLQRLRNNFFYFFIFIFFKRCECAYVFLGKHLLSTPQNYLLDLIRFSLIKFNSLNSEKK